MRNFTTLVKGIVASCRKGDASCVAHQIDVGQRMHSAVQARTLEGHDPGSRRRLRADSIGTIVAQLSAAGCVPRNVGRSIAMGQTALLFGCEQAREMQFSSLAQLARLIRRDGKKEEWTIKPKHVDVATELWSRVVAGEVAAASVRSEVDKILGTTPRVPKAKPTMAATIAATIGKASQEDLAVALEQLKATDKDAFRRLFSAAKSLLPPKKPKPAEESVDIQTPSRRPIFSSRAA